MEEKQQLQTHTQKTREDEEDSFIASSITTIDDRSNGNSE
jgi:hypothetical protein